MSTGKVKPFTIPWTLSFEMRPKTKKLTFQFDWMKIQPLLCGEQINDEYIY